MNCELSFLSTISTDFYSKGISSIDDTQNILQGRPYGGLGVLWRKSLHECKVLDSFDDRLLLFNITCGSKQILFVNVYMPYCSNDNLPEFQFYLGKINRIIEDANTPYVYVIGDLNANTRRGQHHLFGDELIDFCLHDNLVLSDVILCKEETYTYFSTAHFSVSWLDHVISSHSAHTLIHTIRVDYSFVSSDHHPLLMDIDVCVTSQFDDDSDGGNKRHKEVIKWD